MKGRKIPSSLFSLFFIVFLDALGVGIVLPVMSYLLLDDASRFSYLSLDIRYFLLGFIVALAPIVQFFGAPIFGALSDHIGRKKVFVISLFGGFLGYILFALGVLNFNLSLIFIGRILDGLAGGNYSIALAAISDLSTKKTKARNFSRVAIAFGAGIILGPVIGAKLSDKNFVSFFTDATPFWFAALLLFINLLFVLFFFQETVKKRAKTHLTALSGVRNIIQAFRLKYIRSLFLIMFSFSFANLLFVYFLQVVSINILDFSQAGAGNLLVYYAFCLIVTQFFITPALSSRFSPYKILRFSLCLLILALPLFLFFQFSYGLAIMIFFIAVFQGVSYINIILLISDSSTSESRGEIFGINQSVESFANILSLLFAGFIAALDPSLLIWIAAALFAIGWGIVISFIQQKSKKLFKEV